MRTTTTGLDGKIYVLGGLSDGVIQWTAEVFDPAVGRWSAISHMPLARYGLAAATGPDGRIYAIGGFDPFSTRDVDAYDPSTGQWSQLGEGFPDTGWLAAATGTDGRIYAFGGCGGPGCVSSFATWAYDVGTGVWQGVSGLNTPRHYLAAAAGSDGRIYAIGGNRLTEFTEEILSSVEAYDPATDTWVEVGSLASPRMGLAAAAGPDGRVYAFGGNNFEFVRLDTVEAYDPLGDTWAAIAPMPTARRDLAAAASGGQIFAIGGHGLKGVLTTVEAYTP